MSKNMSTAAAQTAPRHGLQNVRTLVSCALLAAVSVVLARFIIPMPNETTRFSLEAVPIFLAALPIMCVYPFLQKYYTKGIVVGSVKG